MYNTSSSSLIDSLQQKRALGFSGALLRGVLVFALLFVQAVSLNHTHSGELTDSVDCDICLKIGSSDDVLVSTTELPLVKAPSTTYSGQTLEPLFSATFRATARAPPLA